MPAPAAAVGLSPIEPVADGARLDAVPAGELAAAVSADMVIPDDLTIPTFLKRAVQSLNSIAAGAILADPTLAAHVAEIHRLRKRFTANTIEIGRHLTECQGIVGHGNWQTFLDREFEWSATTAPNFMRVFALTETESTNFADLDLPVSSLYLLAAPSTPEEARTEIISRAEAGEKVSGRTSAPSSRSSAREIPTIPTPRSRRWQANVPPCSRTPSRTPTRSARSSLASRSWRAATKLAQAMPSSMTAPLPAAWALPVRPTRNSRR